MTVPSQIPTIAFAAPIDRETRRALGRPVNFELVERPVGDATDLAELAASAEILVTRAHHRVDRPILERGRAGRLHAVVQASSGCDNIDETAARALGVEVVVVDPGNAAAVAELVVLSLLALLRRAEEHWRATRAGVWPDREALDDDELGARRVGLVGLGRIGRRVAGLLGAFGSEVVAYDPYLDGEAFAAAGAARAATLDDLLSRVDALSLHCPLTPRTRGMIGRRELTSLPRGAVFVNTARGAIVQAEALLEVLDAGHVAGAALDVHAIEPPPAGDRLVSHPRVLPTPHLGGHTRPSHRTRAARLAATLVRVATAWAERKGDAR